MQGAEREIGEARMEIGKEIAPDMTISLCRHLRPKLGQQMFLVLLFRERVETSNMPNHPSQRKQ